MRRVTATPVPMVIVIIITCLIARNVGDGGDPHHQCQSSTITEKIDQDLDHRVTCMTIKSTVTVGLQDQNMVSSNMIVVQMIG